jgi:hypothetical protein
MMIHNIQPGQVMTSNPELFWGLIARCDWQRDADILNPHR